MGPAIGLSTVLGPVVAGLLMKLDLFGSDWRALFLINLPIGVFALLLGDARAARRCARPTAALRLDGVGTALLATASFLLVFPLVDGRTQGWPAWMFALLAASVPMLALFVGCSSGRGCVPVGTPLVELSVLRKRSYVSGIVFTLVFFGSIVGFSLTTGLFLQIGLGFDPDAGRACTSPRSRSARSSAPAWAPGPRQRSAGRSSTSGWRSWPSALRCSTSRSVAPTAASAGRQLAPGMFVFGLGMGMIFVPLFSIIMGEIEDHEVGSASGLLESLQQLGASLGVAALARCSSPGSALEDGGPSAAMAAGRHLLAAEHTLLAVVLIAFACAIGLLLPRRARAMS